MSPADGLAAAGVLRWLGIECIGWLGGCGRWCLGGSLRVGGGLLVAVGDRRRGGSGSGRCGGGSGSSGG